MLRHARDTFHRLLTLLVPREWRATVARDLEIEARQTGRGAAWQAWQTARAGAALRSFMGGSAMWFDLRMAIRSLSHARGFTASAVITLALGIGVNLAVFAVVDRALFRPLPFAHMDRLVFVTPYAPESGQRSTAFSKRLLVEARQTLPAIEDMGYAGFASAFALVADPAAPALALTEASFNLLDVLGATPVLGRGFNRGDAETNAGVALLAYETWQARFGGALDVIGVQARRRNGTTTIIGVLPEGFIAPVLNRGARFDGLYLVPDVMDSWAPREAVDPSVVRVAPGASRRVVQQQFDDLARRLDPELAPAGRARGPRVIVDPLRAGMFWSVHRYLWLVTLAASLVALLASANLSGLLLARGRSRTRESALRVSLGAAPVRIVRVEVAQSLALCLIGGGVALLVFYWASALVGSLVPGFFRQFVLATLEWRTVLFAAVTVAGCSVVAAVLPAWRATHTDLVGALQQGAGGPSHARRPRAGWWVLALEAALGVVLVTGAAVAGRNLTGLMAAEVGFTPDGLHVLQIAPATLGPDASPQSDALRYRQMIDALRSDPTIVAVAGVDSMPSNGAAPIEAPEWNGVGYAGLWRVSDGFADAIGARLVAGRDLTRRDADERQPVAVITRAAARALWPGATDADVVGRPIAAPGRTPGTVVGVLADIRDRPDRTGAPRVFVALAGDAPIYGLDVVVRTRSGAPPSADHLQRRLAHLNVTAVTTREAGLQIRSALEQPQAQAIIFGGFAAVGLVLAAVGLFAVAAFDVALRTYELGIRRALGASAQRVHTLVIIETLAPVLVGCVAGLGAAYWAAAYLQSLVHDIDARDPWTLALVVLVLILTTIVAAWIPARRASKTDPATVLRVQ